MYGLDALLTAFPDAAIIQTLRNPVDVLFNGTGERDQFRMREALKLEEMLNRITRFRDARPELAGRFIDVKYRELVSDPLC